MPCLTKDTNKKFLDAIRRGVITPGKMLETDSAGRLATLEPIVGKENAQWVNAALENKILLKDQQRGMVSWAKKVSGISEPIRRDLISKIQKQPKVFDPVNAQSFLESLAAKRLGHEISFDEAKNISRMARDEQSARLNIKGTEPIRSPVRLEYGLRHLQFKEYVDGLKQAAGKVGPTWYLKHPFQSITRMGGAAKSILSTLDNSYFGRQGIKVLMTHPGNWVKNFVKSWGDIGKELYGMDAMKAIRADIYSRPNALNGKYAAAKLDLGVGTEEAFPSHVLVDVFRDYPPLKRVFSAAESAFNGAALRFRADIGDKIIAAAERNGVDMLDPAQAEPLGRIVNSMTGRGNIGRLDVFGKEINSLIFSIKFLKSNFDTLTAHQFQKGITPYARKIAATNLLKIAGSLATLYTAANLLKPGSAELDPRSSKFGKIQSGDTTFDPTGGMANLATLGARIVPTVHNGKWGFWSKSPNGEMKELGTGKFGTRSPMDVVTDFAEGKFAPYAALLKDLWKGQDFQGRKTYVEGYRFLPNLQTVGVAHAPIPIQNLQQNMSDPNSANLIMATILDELGISTNTYTPRPAKAHPSNATMPGVIAPGQSTRGTKIH